MNDDTEHPTAPPVDPHWFWTEEWRRGEAEADAQIAAGDLPTYDDMAALLADLGAPAPDPDRPLILVTDEAQAHFNPRPEVRALLAQILRLGRTAGVRLPETPDSDPSPPRGPAAPEPEA